MALCCLLFSLCSPFLPGGRHSRCDQMTSHILPTVTREDNTRVTCPRDVFKPPTVKGCDRRSAAGGCQNYGPFWVP